MLYFIPFLLSCQEMKGNENNFITFYEKNKFMPDFNVQFLNNFQPKIAFIFNFMALLPIIEKNYAINQFQNFIFIK